MPGAAAAAAAALLLAGDVFTCTFPQRLMCLCNAPISPSVSVTIGSGSAISQLWTRKQYDLQK